MQGAKDVEGSALQMNGAEPGRKRVAVLDGDACGSAQNRREDAWFRHAGLLQKCSSYEAPEWLKRQIPGPVLSASDSEGCCVSVLGQL